jgi:lysophospholipase L1-like esterase
VGGRGLIFPYSAAAKCNNPSDYKVHCAEKVILTRNVYKDPLYPMGLCGISVTAQDVPTRIQSLNNDKQFDYGVSRIVVLGYSPSGVVPNISYSNSNALPSYIDSVNHRFVFNLREQVDSFDIVLPCSQGQSFTLTGVYLSSRNHGITYNSVGVNGAAVPDYFKCALTSDLKLLRPDLVIFGIGINDAHAADFDSVAFKQNYLRLCDSIRSVNPQCAFIFITNNDCFRRKSRKRYEVNRNGLLARDVFYRLAKETDGAVWDQFEIMGGLKSMDRWYKAKLAQKDRVHFTVAGYQLVGNLFTNALFDAYNQYTKRHPISTTR